VGGLNKGVRQSMADAMKIILEISGFRSENLVVFSELFSCMCVLIVAKVEEFTYDLHPLAKTLTLHL
jgi:hypothetical protein